MDEKSALGSGTHTNTAWGISTHNNVLPVKWLWSLWRLPREQSSFWHCKSVIKEIIGCRMDEMSALGSRTHTNTYQKAIFPVVSCFSSVDTFLSW